MDFLFPGIYIVEETAEFHDHVIHEATQKESFDKKEDAHEFSTKAVPAQNKKEPPPTEEQILQQIIAGQDYSVCAQPAPW